jgi:hypothetical protein
LPLQQRARPLLQELLTEIPMKPLTALLLAVVVSGTRALAAGSEPQSQLGQSRATAAEFMKTLKGELMAAMQAGGPVNAITVCNKRAPAIAAELGALRGWEIGRTSLKPRNMANAPDEWERSVLERFEQRKRAGEDPAGLEYFEVVEQDGQMVFRYMKAIPTGELCLACHGAKLDPAVAARLDALYPKDQARGYQVGDIRGAFTFIEPLSETGN